VRSKEISLNTPPCLGLMPSVVSMSEKKTINLPSSLKTSFLTGAVATTQAALSCRFLPGLTTCFDWRRRAPHAHTHSVRRFALSFYQKVQHHHHPVVDQMVQEEGHGRIYIQASGCSRTQTLTRNQWFQ
jgi:hypothetical protein